MTGFLYFPAFMFDALKSASNTHRKTESRRDNAKRIRTSLRNKSSESHELALSSRR